MRAVQPVRSYLLKNEVASKLGVSVRTINTYMATHGLPYFRRVGRVWFDEAEVDAWVRGER